MAGRVFINYRRDDSLSTAGRLHDRLAQAFGRKNIFMDVDHILPGVDFVNHLNAQVAACDVFLAVVGPKWLAVKDDSGRRRIDNPDDFVMVEIAAALARDIPVIPVMVDGAHLPKAGDLPEHLRPLLRRHAVELRNTQFARDAEALVQKVREAFKGKRAGPSRWLAVTASAAALLLAIWIGLYQMGAPVWMPWTPGVVQPDTGRAEKTKSDADAKRVAEAKAAADAEAKRRADDAEQVSPVQPPAREEQQRQTEAQPYNQQPAQPGGQARRTGSPSDDAGAFVARVLGSTEAQWKAIFAEGGKTYRPPILVMYNGRTPTGCGGMAQSAVAPFYCPTDEKIYLDTSFFDKIENRFHSCSGKACQFSKAYLIAHEVGYHVQNLLGVLPKVQQQQQRISKVEANQLQVRLEQQADCLAGVWANRENQRQKREGRPAFLEPGDVEAAMQTAYAIGDDALQRQATGGVIPDSFTHAASAQRQRWFMTGLKEGNLAACNTFRN